MKVIALAGRKGSGKSTLSKYLVKNEGYQKISFADYLKDLVEEVFLINKAYLYDQSLKESKCISIFTDKDFYVKISNYIKEDITYLCDQKILIETPRHLLQFVGTDVLRKHDVDFHVKKTIIKINSNPSINFVCDDLRFKNELLGLKSVDVESYYVIRTNNWDVSNHASEIDIHWNDIENKIINNVNIELLVDCFKNRYSILSNKENKVLTKESSFLHDNYSFENLSFISGFLYEHKIFNNLNILEFKSVEKYLKDFINDIHVMSDVFFLENLKYWLDPLYIRNNDSWQRGRNHYKNLNLIKL